MGSAISTKCGPVIPSKEVCEKLVNELEASPDYVVLRRFAPVDRYAEDDGSIKSVLMIVDTETTGLDYKTNVVFELGYVLAEFCAKTGKIYKILDRYSGFEDPGFALTPEISHLTGVIDSDVRGKKFDNEKIVRDIHRADIVIAQNAKFDRKFVELLWPEFKRKPWACSIDNGPWAEMAIGVKKQEFLAMIISRVFYDAHRALTDSEVLLDILSHQAHDGKTILYHVVTNSHPPVYRVWATGAPFDKKDFLKNEAGFSWSDGTEEGKLKAWYKERVPEKEIEGLLDMLAENVYPGDQKVEVDRIDSVDKFSTRITSRTLRHIRSTVNARSDLSTKRARIEVIKKSPAVLPKRVLVLTQRGCLVT
jgi:DNA polymerase-3 subunit epsilon